MSVEAGAREAADDLTAIIGGTVATATSALPATVYTTGWTSFSGSTSRAPFADSDLGFGNQGRGSSAHAFGSWQWERSRSGEQYSHFR